jgi:peptidoglycan/LPS O-acetylase OafA/YrhL
MSDTDRPPLAPPPVPPPPRSGCLTAFLVIVGVVLLLPGVCVLAVSKDLYSDPLFGVVAIIASLVGIGGITLIWLAQRRPRR